MLEELSLHHKYEAPPEVPARAPGTLKGLNLDTELFNNYRDAKDFLETVLHDSSIAPNQVAQTFNTLTAILKEIVKSQTEVYNAERVKLLEQAMILALKNVPEDAQNLFFTEFERLCKSIQ